MRVLERKCYIWLGLFFLCAILRALGIYDVGALISAFCLFMVLVYDFADGIVRSLPTLTVNVLRNGEAPDQ